MFRNLTRLLQTQPMDALYKQRLQAARFQCNAIRDQLHFLDCRMDWHIWQYSTRINPFGYRDYWVSMSYFGLEDRQSTYSVVQREEFDIQNYTHLWIVKEYINIIHGKDATSDWHVLRQDECSEEIIEKWSNWETIEGRLGFTLPIMEIREMVGALKYVDEAWPRVWAGIRLAGETASIQDDRDTGLQKRKIREL